MSEDIILHLSTKIAPPKRFTVDEDEYVLKGVDHLSKTEEATVTALLAQHARMGNELAMAGTIAKGQTIAEKMRKVRIHVLAHLTNAPKDVLETLPLTAQVQLLETAQEVLQENELDGVEDVALDRELEAVAGPSE